MSFRTTKAAVKYVMDTTLEDDEIDAYIGHANLIVSRVTSDEGLGAELLKQIETYLAAHLIAIGKERQPLEERVGDIWLVYQESPAGFLESTTYGRMVLFLDTSGVFQKTSMKKATIKAIKQNNC